MSGKTCQECSKIFNRPADMRRHCRDVHGKTDCFGDGVSARHAPPHTHNSQSRVTILQHPFTMCISGPTSCGKTFLVKNILQSLQKNTSLVNPKPQRIVWLYKRWQPLYSELKTTVYPPIEFHRGIPNNLEEDEYLDPGKTNLIVLDDLMTTASKDRRVTDLFTEGSHHRNLSVISLNQNLYYSKDPTQRRNCHYIVLFNNPVDQRPVITLARQMYLQNSCVFMREFHEATSNPHGYLLVDLKLNTLPNNRLRPNGLTGSVPLACTPMSGDKKRDWKTYCGDDEDDDDDDDVELPDLMGLYQKERKERRRSVSCPECGIVFQTIPQMIRHAQKVHK